MGLANFWDHDANRYIHERWLGTWESVRDARETEDAVLRYLSSCTGRLLDLGCGPGYWLIRLISNNYDIVGVDRSLARSRLAAENSRVVCGDAIQLPFMCNTFSVTLSIHLTEYVSDLSRLCTEVHRVTQLGGAWIIITKNPAGIPWRVAESVASMAHVNPHLPRPHGISEITRSGLWGLERADYLGARMITNLKDVNDSCSFSVPRMSAQLLQAALDALPSRWRQFTAWHYAGLYRRLEG